MKLKPIYTMNNVERAELLFTLIPTDNLQPTTRSVAQAIYNYADSLLQREEEDRKQMAGSLFSADQWLYHATEAKTASQSILSGKKIKAIDAAERLFGGQQALFSVHSVQH
jgi:hypothetical protein